MSKFVPGYRVQSVAEMDKLPVGTIFLAETDNRAGQKLADNLYSLTGSTQLYPVRYSLTDSTQLYPVGEVFDDFTPNVVLLWVPGVPLDPAPMFHYSLEAALYDKQTRWDWDNLRKTSVSVYATSFEEACAIARHVLKPLNSDQVDWAVQAVSIDEMRRSL